MSTSGHPHILVTRDLTDEQLSLAKDLGLTVSMRPAISIEFRNEWLAVQNAIDNAKTPILVFTSQNGVKALERFKQAGVNIPDGIPVFAVGSKTKKALADIGFSNVQTPQQQNGVGLAHLMIDDILNSPELKDAEVIHFCGDKRRDELRHYLTESEIRIKDLVVYKTTLNQMTLSEMHSFDGVLFYSPSAVQAFRQSGGFRQTETLPELFAIGPTTAEELSIESGRHVHISPEPDTEEFLNLVARVLGEEKVKGER